MQESILEPETESVTTEYQTTSHQPSNIMNQYFCLTTQLSIIS